MKKGAIVMFKSMFQGAAAALVLIFVCVGVLSILDWMVPRDSTDAPERRSGMSLYTDHETGCQYLAAAGGLTPRLLPTGAQACLEGPAK